MTHTYSRVIQKTPKLLVTNIHRVHSNIHSQIRPTTTSCQSMYSMRVAKWRIIVWLI